MPEKVELLAPAGDWEAFKAAVENGADAAYLGGKLFNARQSASNFDDEDLKRALDYAHIRDVKIYLTMNTLLSDSEIDKAADYAQKAYLMGIDGIIVQDIGLAGVLRRTVPGLELHASTQMTIYNIEGAKLLKEQGYKRIVLARELSLDEIMEIAENVDIELEVFAHGALCICYSGQCLMSSLIGGRSGNRGRCAQPCRLKYEIFEYNADRIGKSAASNASYLLSPKDLCSLKLLPEIIATGVKSLKLEGRMKSAEYVAVVVGIYRKHLELFYNGIAADPHTTEADMKILMQVFNRGGFSSGYLKGKSGSSMMSYEKPKNWGVFLGNTVSYDQGARTIKVDLKEKVSIGDGIEVWNKEDESPGTIVTGIKVGGKQVDFAEPGNIAVLASLSGRIYKGNKVYKTSDKAINTAARESFSEKFLRKIPLDAEMLFELGKPIVLKVRDSRGNSALAEGELACEPALKAPLTEERIRSQLQRTGATPFEFNNIAISMKDELAVPVSEINSVRRKALEAIECERSRIAGREISTHAISALRSEITEYGPCISNEQQRKELNFSLYYYDFGFNDQNVDFSTIGADRVYIPLRSLLGDRNKVTFMVNRIKQQCKELYVSIPSITRGNYDKLIRSSFKELVDCGIDGVSAGNPGALEFFRDFPGLKITGDYTLNVFNSYAAAELCRLGTDEINISPELNLAQISELRAGIPIEVTGYGRIALMTSEYCPAGSIYGGYSDCNACSRPCTKSGFYIKDRMGMTFPLKCDNIDCRSIIFNCNVLFFPEYLERLRKSTNVTRIRLNITDEAPETVSSLVALYKAAGKNYESASKKYSDLIASVKEKGFTKGHLFRGV